MSVLEFTPVKIKNNKKKYIILSIIILILLILFLFYFFNASFRYFITINIFRKQVSQDKLTSIALAENETSFVYSYDKYITILNKNILYTYNSSGNVISKLDINISSPIFESNNKFMVILNSNNKRKYEGIIC